VKVRSMAPPAEPDGPITARRMYTVHLGNGRVQHFTSERNALAFQADASRFITDQMHEVNLLLADCFAAYRTAWPMLHGKDHLPTAAACRLHLQTATDLLDRSVTHTSGPNGYAFAWRFVGGAAAELGKMCQVLQLKFAARSWYVEVRRLRSLHHRANMVADDLQAFGS
jgi:hypothetical protein